MILIPVLLVAAFLGWQMVTDHTRREASRRFVRIDYRASDRRRR